MLLLLLLCRELIISTDQSAKIEFAKMNEVDLQLTVSPHEIYSPSSFLCSHNNGSTVPTTDATLERYIQETNNRSNNDTVMMLPAPTA